MKKFTMYKPNAKGTGSALSMELCPSTVDRDGYLTLTIAPQKTVGDARGPNPTFPTFDWDSRVSVDVDFDGICQILQVFRGEIESINEDKGKFYREINRNIIVKFSHQVDPICRYVLEVYTSVPGKNDGDSCAYFCFTPAEALGITIALESSMSLVVFGSQNDDGSSIADVMKKIADA